jgi:phenylacetate-CoA ligase
MSDRGARLFGPEPQWRAVQAQRLRAHVNVARQSLLYRNADIPSDADLAGETLDQTLARLPLTTKAQLADAGPKAWAVAPERVAEWVCTSGTAGRPLDVPLTAADLDRLAENEAAALELAGVRGGDLFVLAVGMERLFVAGLAYWLGARRLGASCVRVGPQLATQANLLQELVKRYGTGAPDRRSFVIAVPSFLITVDAAALPRPLDGIIAIGEPIRAADGPYNALGHRLHDAFCCPVMSTYALTETCTTFAEGPLCKGGHLNPALGVVECLDDAGRPVELGTVGEIVVTPLGVEGLPLLRFRTGDMAALHTAPCPCGRTTPRVGPIVGRLGQLLKFKGTSIYPGAIVDTLRAHAGVADCVVVATQTHALSDQLTVYIEPRPDACDPGGNNLPRAAIRAQFEAALRGLLRATPEIRYVQGSELKAIQTASGSRKLPRFIDRR